MAWFKITFFMDMFLTGIIFSGIFINIPAYLFGHGEKLDKSSTPNKTSYIRDMINENFKEVLIMHKQSMIDLVKIMLTKNVII
jgi:hypothetical protein